MSDETTTTFRNVLGQFPTGVVVVTGAGSQGPVGLTIQSFMALSLDPAMVLVSIDRKSTSWPAIRESGRFAVNIMSSQQEAIARSFAQSGGPKFADVTWFPGEHTGAPVITGCQAWLECEVDALHAGGDHEIVTAHVLTLGSVDDPQSHPLVYFRSRFPRFDRGHWSALTS
jgi:flavin reductase (DIM6/NTAB) family NADH-FMN oxidoreductase RutF